MEAQPQVSASQALQRLTDGLVKDERFRHAFKVDPLGAIEALGIEIPEGLQERFVEIWSEGGGESSGESACSFVADEVLRCCAAY